MGVDWIQIALVPIIAFAGWYLRSGVEMVRREKEKLQDERRKIYIQVLEPYIRIFAGFNNPSEKKKALSQLTSFDYRRGYPSS